MFFTEPRVTEQISALQFPVRTAIVIKVIDEEPYPLRAI